MTTREVVEELDKYIVGQKDAKDAVAIALRSRWRRANITDVSLRSEITPKLCNFALTQSGLVCGSGSSTASGIW